MGSSVPQAPWEQAARREEREVGVEVVALLIVCPRMGRAITALRAGLEVLPLWRDRKAQMEVLPPTDVEVQVAEVEEEAVDSEPPHREGVAVEMADAAATDIAGSFIKKRLPKNVQSSRSARSSVASVASSRTCTGKRAASTSSATSQSSHTVRVAGRVGRIGGIAAW